MMNSSFFLKQLGYLTMLKYWKVFVKEPTSCFSYPKFMSNQLLDNIMMITDMEANDIIKEMDNEVGKLQEILNGELSDKIRDIFNQELKEDSQHYYLRVDAIRSLILQEQTTVRQLQEASKKLDRFVSGESFDELSSSYYANKPPPKKYSRPPFKQPGTLI